MQLSAENTWTRFINLDKSVARRKEAEQVLSVLEPVIGTAKRFSAIAHEKGWIGCALSHLAILAEALDTAPSEIEHLAIFEDDIMWRPNVDVASVLAMPIRNRFDMLILAYPPWFPESYNWQALTHDSQLMRLTGGNLAWTTGYIAHRRFWSVLHRQWTKTLTKIEIDVSWRQLLAQHVFLCYTPVLGNQSGSRSTINLARRIYNHHTDPNITFVSKALPALAPIDRLYPTVPSLDIAKQFYDFAIVLQKENPIPLSKVIQMIQFCKQRWIHGLKGCVIDFTKPRCFCDCYFWP